MSRVESKKSSHEIQELSINCVCWGNHVLSKGVSEPGVTEQRVRLPVVDEWLSRLSYFAAWPWVLANRVYHLP